MNIIELPKNILNTVLYFLPPENILEVAKTCTTLRDACKSQSELIWRTAALRLNIPLDLKESVLNSKETVLSEMRRFACIAKVTKIKFWIQNFQTSGTDPASFENKIENLIKRLKKPALQIDVKKKPDEILMQNLFWAGNPYLFRLALYRDMLQPSFENLWKVIGRGLESSYFHSFPNPSFPIFFEELLKRTKISEEQWEQLFTLAIQLSQVEIVMILLKTRVKPTTLENLRCALDRTNVSTQDISIANVIVDHLELDFSTIHILYKTIIFDSAIAFTFKSTVKDYELLSKIIEKDFTPSLYSLSSAMQTKDEEILRLTIDACGFIHTEERDAILATAKTVKRNVERKRKIHELVHGPEKEIPSDRIPYLLPLNSEAYGPEKSDKLAQRFNEALKNKHISSLRQFLEKDFKLHYDHLLMALTHNSFSNSKEDLEIASLLIYHFDIKETNSVDYGKTRIFSEALSFINKCKVKEPTLIAQLLKKGFTPSIYSLSIAIDTKNNAILALVIEACGFSSKEEEQAALEKAKHLKSFFGQLNSNAHLPLNIMANPQRGKEEIE